jgi:hypothetical protein
MSPCGKGMYPDEVVKIVDRYLPLANEDKREQMAKDILLLIEKSHVRAAVKRLQATDTMGGN